MTVTCIKTKRTLIRDLVVLTFFIIPVHSSKPIQISAFLKLMTLAHDRNTMMSIELSVQNYSFDELFTG